MPSGRPRNFGARAASHEERRIAILCAAGGCIVTPQEQQLLNSLAERVNSTQLQEKDPDAEAFLNRSFNSNPDAVYILAQTVLVQNIALEQARAQIAQFQQQAQQARQPAHATSFLGSLLGHRDPEPPPPPAYAPPVQTQYAEPPYQPVQQGPYQSLPPQPQYAPVASTQPSFLRGAMQTAAGVAAGALAFEGVESVLHGLSGHPGYGWGEPGMGMGGIGMGGIGMGGGLERPVDETVINNYYDQPAGDQRINDQGRDSADRGGAQFSDASYNTAGDNSNQGFDDSSQDAGNDFDGGGQNDSGFGDDSGGFDDGGGNDLV